MKIKIILGGGILYAFDDVISPHANTEPAMKKLFNFCNHESKNEWFTYQNIFNILKATNYYTVWLSVQESSVFSAIGPSAIYSKLCDVSKFTDIFNDKSVIKDVRDEALLPFLDDVMKETHEKNFYLLHLIGTHANYYKRFTSAFKKFKADEEFRDNGFDSFSQRSMRADYDNAVLYNDFVINEIIKRFEDKNAILFYLSDHGEEIYDSRDYLGHGEVGSPDRNTIEIPFLIWLSEKFRTEYPELDKKIAASVHRPYMTDDLIHTILDIAGIETPDYEPERSIINEKFNASRPRIFMNFIYGKETGLNEIP